MDIESFDCAVCWNNKPMFLSVACTKFEVPDYGDDDIEMDEDVETDSSESDSSEASREADSDDYFDAFEANLKSNKEKAKKESHHQQHVPHLFCDDCIRAQATNACDDAPLAKGGVGLCCMENKCDGVLLLSSFRKFLTADILTRLEDRMQHETIINAKIKNLERCLKCNYGQVMPNKAFKKKNLKFKCNECSSAHCRLCKAPWKRLHIGKTCWQFKWADKARNGYDTEATPDFIDAQAAQKLTDNIMRTCPKCNLSFLKTHGCNLLRCRCGEAQCYSCRANDIGYDHFCNCTSKKTTKKCCEKCDLFDDVKARERTERNDILKNAKRKYETETNIVAPVKQHSFRKPHVAKNPNDMSKKH